MGSPDNAEYGMLVSKVSELESALSELQATVFGLVGAGASDDHAEHVVGPRQLPLVMSLGSDEGTSIRGERDEESDAAAGDVVMKRASDSNVVVTAHHSETGPDTLEVGVYYV